MSKRWNAHILVVGRQDASEHRMLHVYNEPYAFGKDPGDFARQQNLDDREAWDATEIGIIIAYCPERFCQAQ
ncbi:MAG: hypothetical protein GY862_19835 [Gammaproteobacteria bacterium]|nr:hypothetical protein [Gammaproteobacteria bacterium]